MYERERGGGEGGREGRAIHVPLIHSIFVVAFILFFFFFTLRTVYVFCIRYKIDIISSNLYRSVVWMTQVFDQENVLFRKRCCKFLSEKIALYFAVMVI